MPLRDREKILLIAVFLTGVALAIEIAHRNKGWDVLPWPAGKYMEPSLYERTIR